MSIKSDKTDKTKSQMIEALEVTHSIVTDACKRVGISRETHYKWMKVDEDYKARVEALSDVALDFVEGQLFKNISEGDVVSTIFFLKTKGKKRGYIERTEQDLTLRGIKFGKDAETYE